MLNPLSVLRKRQDVLRARAPKSQSNRSDERRFAGVLPFEENLFGRKIILTRHILWRQLLHSIQANKITCSIHISSDTLKARATLITLNGRGLACVFRARGQNQVTIGERAFMELMMSIREPDCTFNLALIPMEIAYGMASICYGKSTSRPATDGGSDFRQAVESLKRSRGAGCIQVTSAVNDVLVTAFVFDGETQCFASANKRSDEQAISRLIKKTADATCRVWNVNDIKEFDPVIFELTALNASEEHSAKPVRFGSTEEFLLQFYKKPNMRESFLNNQLSAKEKHEVDILEMSEISFRKSANGHSHMINPMYGGTD